MKNLIIPLIAVIFLGCGSQFFIFKKRIKYLDKDRTIAVCFNCKALKNLPNSIEHLEIEDWKCNRIPSTIFELPRLKTLVINCKKVAFPSSFKKVPSTLQTISILNPVLDSIPEFVHATINLKRLNIFLKDGKYLDNEELVKLKKLKSLKLGVSELINIPSFIYNFQGLEELVILSERSEANLRFEKSLKELQALVILEAPIDLKPNLKLLLEISTLQRLRVRKFSELDSEYHALAELENLQEICIDEISPYEQARVTEIIPDVRFFCKDRHILPLGWEK